MMPGYSWLSERGFEANGGYSLLSVPLNGGIGLQFDSVEFNVGMRF